MLQAVSSLVLELNINKPRYYSYKHHTKWSDLSSIMWYVCMCTWLYTTPCVLFVVIVHYPCLYTQAGSVDALPLDSLQQAPPSPSKISSSQPHIPTTTLPPSPPPPLLPEEGRDTPPLLQKETELRRQREQLTRLGNQQKRYESRKVQSVPI